MALRIVTPPAKDSYPITLPEVRGHLRIDDDASDALLGREIEAVTDWLAGPHGWLGRSLLSQVIALTVSLPIVQGFTGPQIGRSGMSGIILPRPPVIEVRTVEMLDASGVATAISSDGYNAFECDDGLTRLTFLPSFRWPVIASGPAALRVTYRAGYGAAADVPAGLRHAMLMAVARLHEARGDPFSTSLQDDPQIARMFSVYRVWA